MSDRCYHLSKLSLEDVLMAKLTVIWRENTCMTSMLSVLSAQGGGWLCACTAMTGLSMWILLLWTKWSYSHVLFSMRSACSHGWYSLWMETQLRNFTCRENNILQFLEAEVDSKGSIDLAADQEKDVFHVCSAGVSHLGFLNWAALTAVFNFRDHWIGSLVFLHVSICTLNGSVLFSVLVTSFKPSC